MIIFIVIIRILPKIYTIYLHIIFIYYTNNLCNIYTHARAQTHMCTYVHRLFYMKIFQDLGFEGWGVDMAGWRKMVVAVWALDPEHSMSSAN